MTLQDFRPAGEVVADDRRRIPASKAGVEPSAHYSVSVHSDGRILLTPLALIPKRELIVWQDKVLGESLMRGVQQVVRGEIADLDLTTLEVTDDE
jgi:hypothetical protein